MPTTLLFLASYLSSIQNPGEAVDKLIAAELKSSRIPGLSLVVVQHDKVIKRTAYGINDLEQKTSMTTDLVFESGSIGKSFTATLTLLLAEEGKLSLDDTLEKRLPKCPDRWKTITLRQLLNQVSGLPDYALVPGLGLVETWTYDQWLTKMSTLPFDFPTGKAFAYSNTNYLIMGKVIEEITKEPHTETVKKRIFDVAGMKRSYVADQQLIIPHRAHGYLKGPEGFANGLFIPPGYADGSFINHPDDLIAYERALREKKILKPESLLIAQTSAKLPTGRKTGYGMGWFVRNIYGTSVVSHGGNTGGFFASLTRIESADMTIVLMGNVFDVPGDSIALKVAQEYVPDLKPKKLSEKPDPDPTRTAKLLKALQSLAAQKPDDSLLDPEMAARLKTGRGQMGMSGLAKFAKVTTLKFLEAVPDEPDLLVRYRVEVDGKPVVVLFVVTAEGKVFAVSARPE